MPFLNQIVCKINAALPSGLSAGLIDGIAYPVIKKTDTGDQLYPAIFDGSAVEKYIGIDDANSNIIYHRQIRNAYSKNAQAETRIIQSVQMLMVVYVKRELIDNATPDYVESLIIGAFPSRYESAQLTGLTGLDWVNVTVTGSEMNPRNVFGGEYQNVPYRLSPDEIYFSISYRLDIQFDKNCLEPCNPNPPDSLCDFIELATAQQILACMDTTQTDAMEEILCTNSCTYDIEINGVFSQQVTLVNCDDLTINLV